MRELAAVAVLFLAFQLMFPSWEEMKRITEAGENDYSFTFGVIISVVAICYLAMCIVERINPKIKKWHRAQPGNPTEMDEAEWKRLEDPKVAAALTGTTPSSDKAAGSEAPPAPKPEPVIYDSGFDENAGKEKPKAAGKDEFEDIFGDEDTGENNK